MMFSYFKEDFHFVNEPLISDDSGFVGTSVWSNKLLFQIEKKSYKSV